MVGAIIVHSYHTGIQHNMHNYLKVYLKGWIYTHLNRRIPLKCADVKRPQKNCSSKVWMSTDLRRIIIIIIIILAKLDANTFKQNCSSKVWIYTDLSKCIPLKCGYKQASEELFLQNVDVNMLKQNCT